MVRAQARQRVFARRRASSAIAATPPASTGSAPGSGSDAYQIGDAQARTSIVSKGVTDEEDLPRCGHRGLTRCVALHREPPQLPLVRLDGTERLQRLARAPPLPRASVYGAVAPLAEPNAFFAASRRSCSSMTRR